MCRIPPHLVERLRRFELALGSGALGLRQSREALTLAGVEALALMVATLAGALALAGIGADAMANRVGRVGCARDGRHAGAGKEKGSRRRCEDRKSVV